MEKLEVDSKSGSDEEFYDCIGETSSNNTIFINFVSSFVCFVIKIFLLNNFFIYLTHLEYKKGNKVTLSDHGMILTL